MNFSIRRASDNETDCSLRTLHFGNSIETASHKTRATIFVSDGKIEAAPIIKLCGNPFSACRFNLFGGEQCFSACRVVLLHMRIKKMCPPDGESWQKKYTFFQGIPRERAKKPGVTSPGFCCIIASSLAFLLDYIDKHTFLSLIERAYHEGLLEKETFPLLQQLISTRAGHVFVLYTALLLICGFVAWRIIRWAGHGNWSTPVTLNKAVEFKFCMNELGIADPGRAFDIAIRYTLPFYIAAEPLIDPVKEHVKARFYPYSFNAGMRDMATLERCLGRQTLCLAVEDFVALKSSYQDQLIAAHVSTIANLKKQAEGLEASLILERESCRKQQEELAALHEENRELQRKQQTLQARDGKGQETRDIRKIPFWRVAVPTIERLLRDAEPDTAYTRTEIQQAFEEELSRHPEIKGDIEALLSTGRKKESGNSLCAGWVGDGNYPGCAWQTCQKDAGSRKNTLIL